MGFWQGGILFHNLFYPEALPHPLLYEGGTVWGRWCNFLQCTHELETIPFSDVRSWRSWCAISAQRLFRCPSPTGCWDWFFAGSLWGTVHPRLLGAVRRRQWFFCWSFWTLGPIPGEALLAFLESGSHDACALACHWGMHSWPTAGSFPYPIKANWFQINQNPLVWGEMHILSTFLFCAQLLQGSSSSERCTTDRHNERWTDVWTGEYHQSSSAEWLTVKPSYRYGVMDNKTQSRSIYLPGFPGVFTWGWKHAVTQCTQHQPPQSLIYLED